MGMRNAFSLVELSIVLVILGLLVGGILAGQSMIRASELRSVTTEYNKWLTASQAFRDKYFLMPGDLKIAETIFGVGTNCPNFTSNDVGTCNGNGDGFLLNSSFEGNHYWWQLGKAGLIEYNLSANLTQKGRLSDAYWNVGGINTALAGTTTTFPLDVQNYYSFVSLGSTYPLMPSEAWNIDTKLDDGFPATGKLAAFKGSTTYPCTTRANQAAGAADTVAEYSLTVNNKVCNFNFLKIF